MTVLKLSKSGKQLQIIDDFGNVYGISVFAARWLLDGKVKFGHSVAQRLPFKVSPERFGVSPLWNPEGSTEVPNISIPPDSGITLNNDAFSYKSLKKEEDNKKYTDKEVW